MTFDEDGNVQSEFVVPLDVAVCRTCGVYREIGYSSCSGWVFDCTTVAEFDAQCAQSASVRSDGPDFAAREFLERHESHGVEYLSCEPRHLETAAKAADLKAEGETA